MNPDEHLVRHLADLRRFELSVGDETAILSCFSAGDHVIFDHTYVPEPLRGRGLAALLTRAALEHARLEGWKIVPSCSYVAAFIKRHPEFQDLIHSL